MKIYDVIFAIQVTVSFILGFSTLHPDLWLLPRFEYPFLALTLTLTHEVNTIRMKKCVVTNAIPRENSIEYFGQKPMEHFIIA